MKVYQWSFYEYLEAAGRRLLPSGRCSLCHAPAADALLCEACVADLPRPGTTCYRCALPLPVAGLCPQCRHRPPPFCSALAALRYEFPVDELLARFKFRGQPGLGKTLADLMATTIIDQALEWPDVLVPVPLHWRRQLQRGYNQALELARPLGRQLGIPLRLDLCVRARPTRAQSDLSYTERRRNLRQAFACHNDIPAHIGIVDDVLTSGQTATALASTLLAAGAESVSVWVLARAGTPG